LHNDFLGKFGKICAKFLCIPKYSLAPTPMVTEFILLISEHLSNRIVYDVKKSPCWASMIHETTNIVTMCCPIHLPQPGQSKDFQLYLVKIKQRNRLFDVTLKALTNGSMNGPESLQ